MKNTNKTKVYATSINTNNLSQSEENKFIKLYVYDKRIPGKVS
jgi:hypothetical protein